MCCSDKFWNLVLAGTLLLPVASSVSVRAAEPAKDESQPAFEALPKNEAGEPIFGVTWPVADLLDTDVQTMSGMVFGKISEVAIDIYSGRIALLLVAPTKQTKGE